MNVVCTDAISYLETCERVKCLIADPPDNIGLKYNSYQDKVPNHLYYDWLELLILKALIKCDVFWLSIYHKHAIEMAYRIRSASRRHPSWNIRTIIWRFTFGQYTDNDMPNGYRPIFLFEGPAANLNWDAIRVPSERMAMGDKRAAGLRIPDDVWEIPRITGNSKDRCEWHPTQHPTELYRRILQLSVRGEKDKAVDLFGGTGTIFRAGKELGLTNLEYVDRDSDYCERVSATLIS